MYEVSERTKLWRKVLEEECNCYADEEGNRPCDNGELCDRCRTEEVQAIFNHLLNGGYDEEEKVETKNEVTEKVLNAGDEMIHELQNMLDEMWIDEDNENSVETCLKYMREKSQAATTMFIRRMNDVERKYFEERGY